MKDSQGHILALLFGLKSLEAMKVILRDSAVAGCKWILAYSTGKRCPI
jgi:hypothetical protein